MSNSETQFSIYKINFEELENLFKIKNQYGTDKYYTEAIDVIINSISSLVKKKNNSQLQIFEYSGFKGIIFKTVHFPDWCGIAEEFLINNTLEEQEKLNKHFLTNTNVSYVFLFKENDSIYACTGGYGSNYINKFVHKNFGLYLLPKLVKKDNHILKNIIQNNLIGNQASTNKVNRNTTSISIEQDYSSIFRQLTVEASKEIMESLGITFEEGESDKKKVSVINKDSLVIRRKLSLSQLKKVICNIYKLEKRKDHFALNYLVLASKKGLKNSDLYEKLVDDFVSGDTTRFVLIGDDYEKYYSTATKYVLTDENNELVISPQEEAITLKKVLELTKSKKDKISNTAIKNTLKPWNISTEDNTGATILYPVNIFDALQGFIEYGEEKTPCYLFNGCWFVFDKQYDDILTKEYREFYSLNAVKAEEFVGHWALKEEATSEDDYNEKLAKRSDLIVAHKALIGNVEIADVIMCENETIYFLHNKGTFNGAGVRDLTNQMLTASDYFLKHKMSYDFKAFLGKYYDSIKNAASTYGRLLPINKDEFVNILFNAKQYVYISGYLNGFKKESSATYAKYLSIELKKKLAAKGIETFTISLN